MKTIQELFHTPDQLADQAARVELSNYLNILRTDRISSCDCSEEGAYFCALPKTHITSIAEAFPILLIHDLYDSNEWDKTESPYKDFTLSEWKTLLYERWIPEYLDTDKNAPVPYRQVSEAEFIKDWLPIANTLFPLALPTPIISIIRYGTIDAWNFSNYFLETQTEYIDFQYWTTA